jgi:hypothetical protein
MSCPRQPYPDLVWLLTIKASFTSGCFGSGEFRLEIERLRDEVLSVLTDLGGVVGLVRAPALGQSLRDSLDRNRLAFADDAALEWRQLLDASERAFANARERVGLDAVVSVIRKRPVSATDLDAAGQVFEARPFWKHLPPWWWHQLRRDVRGDDVNGDGETAVDDATLLEMFCVPRSRNLTQTACARLEALDEALRPAVSLLPPPPQGTTADDHLATEMARFGRELGHARQKYRESLTNLVDAGRLTHQEFLDFADQFDELERRVAPDAFGALTAEAAKFERSARLASFVRALERALDVTAGALAPVGASVEERMACTKDVGWKALRAKTEEYLQGAAADPAEPSADAIELHWADVGTPEDAKDKPPLFFHPHAGNDTSPFGFVRVPIVLLTGRPRRIDLEFAVRDDTDALRAGWPTSADWGSSRVQPTERSIHADEWHKDNREYQVTVPLTVPIRRPSSGQSLEFILTATDRTAVVSRGVARKPYVWDRLVVEADPNDGKPCVSMNWAAAEDPRSAEKVPVGPQIHLTEILERIAMGNSLAVTAPRRFGKSSLIALLEERLRGRKGSDTITVRVDCGAAVQPESTRLDHDKLWALVGKELLTFTVSEQDLALGVGLDGAFDGQTPPLPTPGDFDRVRRKAARLGKKRVVIFFDEAQRLFEAGPSYGARLRSLIATHLGKPTEGLATVVLCFVGLTSMTSARLGADLYPLLNPLTHAELREEQVAKVVRHVTEGSLYTTKLARERIAHSSWNLYALRTILLRLQRHVKDDYRMWATLEDVIAVEASLNSELRQGENPESIATYIRDALNAGATADDFQPVRAFPVAAAYAVALDDNRFGKDAVDATERTLNDWATQIFRDQLARPSYKRDAVEAHLAALDELRVLEYVKDALGGYRFRSEFLRSYLVGQIQHFLYGDDVFRDAMIRGGVRTIRLPADRKAIGRGVQAEVFRFSREQDRREQDLTARVRELRSSDEQLAFLDGLAVLEKIRSIHQGNRGGSEGIYKLRDVGLLEGESPTKAVEVYDYIPGADLEAKLGSLGAPIVVELGLRLARSLGVVHDQDVLHRDIRPKNIILQDHAPLPVLIDFGLACTRSVPGGTPLDDEFTAPEVKRQGAKWTAAADVFALAMTLRRLLPRGGQASDADRELDLALSQLCGPDLAARGHVDRLERILDNFAGRLEIKRREERLNDQLLDLAKNDGRQTELEWVIRQGCRMEINGFALGLYTAERERLRAIATFTNKLAEKAETSVGLWAKGKWSGKWPDGVSAIVDLRNEAAHGPRSAKNLSKEMVRAGVADVALWLKTGALIKIVDVLLRPERT